MAITTALTIYHGRTPSTLQVIATWGVFLASGAIVLTELGINLWGLILALLAADWSAGIITNSAEPVREWWREQDFKWQLAFVGAHAVLIPLVLVLAGTGVVFQIMMVLLAIKMTVFMVGLTPPEPRQE